MGKQFHDSEDIRRVMFCAFDLETTGLSRYSRVLEIGAVRFRHRQEPEAFSTLVRTNVPIQSGARDIHGIEEGMLEGAPSPREAVDSFLDFCTGCILVAHNARFDAAMLSLELSILGIPAPANPILDSLALSRRTFRHLDNHRLQTLADHLQINVDRLHRALPDALAVRGIVEEVLSRFYPLEMREFGDLAAYAGGTLAVRDHSASAAEGSRSRLRSAAIATAVGTGATVNIIYLGGSKGGGARPVLPLRIVTRRGTEYLDAYCLIDERRKLFRIDLIEDIL